PARFVRAPSRRMKSTRTSSTRRQGLLSWSVAGTWRIPPTKTTVSGLPGAVAWRLLHHPRANERNRDQGQGYENGDNREHLPDHDPGGAVAAARTVVRLPAVFALNEQEDERPGDPAPPRVDHLGCMARRATLGTIGVTAARPPPPLAFLFPGPGFFFFLIIVVGCFNLGNVVFFFLIRGPAPAHSRFVGHAFPFPPPPS